MEKPWSGMDEAERRAYHAEANRRARARKKAAREAGEPAASRAELRDALADAALMILAAGGPGAGEIQAALRTAFPGKPGFLLDAPRKALSAAMVLDKAEREAAEPQATERWDRIVSRNVAAARRNPWAPKLLTIGALRR